MAPKNSQKTHSEIALEKATEAAHHYGFYHLSELLEANNNTNTCTTQKKKAKKTHDKEVKAAPTPEDLEKIFAGLTQIYKEHDLAQIPHPLLIYHSNKDITEKNNPTSTTQEQKQTPFFALHAIGVKHNIGEAIVIKAALAILKDMGITDVSVSINSIGDSESAATFNEELISHFRKNLHIFPAKCRETFKRDTFETLKSVRRHAPVLLPTLPKPMQFLTEESRKHLRGVIEYLDSEDIPYELDESLVGPKHCYKETVFEIRRNPKNDENSDLADEEESGILATGGRYSELAKKIHNLELPAVGINIFIKKEKEKPKRAPLPKKRRENAWVYLVQIGPQARVKSFAIIEKLREAGIPLLQSIINEQMQAQLKESEASNITHLIIIGQKEAMENTVIVKEVESQIQEAVKIDELVNYLKKVPQMG